MSAKWTRDERFIVCAYEATLRTGDLNTILDRYDIGKQSGITAKGVNAIGKLLMQANFIKLIGKTEMQLTKHGESLAQRLLQE
jgi:predicted transcriptional regulator